MFKHRLSRHGFTLVELSIVLVIVGLLIGGVLIGHSLVESAENNKVINQVSQYKILMQQFHSKFKKWPGDANFFTSQNNGNNDGIIDEVQAENAKLMSHLYLTGMISKEYTAYTTWPNITINQFMQGPHEGSVFMVKKLGPHGSPVINSFGWGPHTSSTNTQLDEQYLNYGKFCNASGTYARTTCGLLTPSQAAAIDGKMDDGLPTSGKVRGVRGIEYTPDNCGNGDNGATGTIYLVQKKTPECTMMFYLRRYGQIDQ